MEIEKLIKIMSDPSFYPHKPEKVEIIQTHISIIFIAGNLVYKVKKPVNFGFLDFSTLEKRKFFCEREIELNRRLSPDIYLRVEPIIIENRIVEYAVVMKRLPIHMSLKNLIKNRNLKREDIERTVKIIADFHRSAETNETIKNFGKVKNFRKNTDENFEQTEKFIGITIKQEDYDFIKDKTEEFYKKYGDLLDQRAERGCVKDCHGDLHSEHIIITPKKIWIFDCIEFNDRFRYIDVACDIAFLLMDMEFLNKKNMSSLAFKIYKELMQDKELDKVVPFFKSYRAYVRGKVNSLMLDDPNIDEADKNKFKALARNYFVLSKKYLEDLT